LLNRKAEGAVGLKSNIQDRKGEFFLLKFPSKAIKGNEKTKNL